MQGDYDIALVDYLNEVFQASEESGASMMMPWELVPFHVPPGRAFLVVSWKFMTRIILELVQCMSWL
jgi:hypothetical protein